MCGGIPFMASHTEAEGDGGRPLCKEAGPEAGGGAKGTVLFTEGYRWACWGQAVASLHQGGWIPASHSLILWERKQPGKRGKLGTIPSSPLGVHMNTHVLKHEYLGYSIYRLTSSA